MCIEFCKIEGCVQCAIDRLKRIEDEIREIVFELDPVCNDVDEYVNGKRDFVSLVFRRSGVPYGR